MLQCLAGYFVEAFAKNLLAVVGLFHETFVRGENSSIMCTPMKLSCGADM